MLQEDYTEVSSKQSNNKQMTNGYDLAVSKYWTNWYLLPIYVMLKWACLRFISRPLNREGGAIK